MKTLVAWVKAIKNQKRPNIPRSVVFGIVFGILACILIPFIRAVGPSTSIEPEQGSVNGNAVSVNDPSASGGSYLMFGGNHRTPPSNIASDCSVDVATDLNNWLDSIPNGAVITLPKDACYLTETSIKIISKQNWIVNGNNATIKRTVYNNTTADMRHLHLGDDTNLTISNLNILGQKPVDSGYAIAVEGQMGVGIYGGNNVTIDDFNIQHVHGDFVYINKYQGTSAQNITVKNSLFTDSGRQGIAIIDGNGVVIRNNDITNSDRYIIDLEPGGSTTNILNVTFDNNHFSSGGLGFLSGEGGGGNIANLTLSNNVINGSMTVTIDPPGTTRRGPISIINNSSQKGAARDLLEFHAVDGILVKDNHLAVKANASGGPAHALVNLINTTNAQVINNITDNALVSVSADANAAGYCELGNIPISLGIPICQ